MVYKLLLIIKGYSGMGKFVVKYQAVHKGMRPIGANLTTVTASNMWEAREVFKSSHINHGDITYKIVSCVKTGK
jgi:hypothetical protein